MPASCALLCREERSAGWGTWSAIGVVPAQIVCHVYPWCPRGRRPVPPMRVATTWIADRTVVIVLPLQPFAGRGGGTRRPRGCRAGGVIRDRVDPPARCESSGCSSLMWKSGRGVMGVDEREQPHPRRSRRAAGPCRRRRRQREYRRSYGPVGWTSRITAMYRRATSTTLRRRDRRRSACPERVQRLIRSQPAHAVPQVEHVRPARGRGTAAAPHLRHGS